MVVAARQSAAANGHGGRTRAEVSAYVAAHPLPVCKACGRTVLPEESAVSAHPNFHFDCA